MKRIQPGNQMTEDRRQESSEDAPVSLDEEDAADTASPEEAEEQAAEEELSAELDDLKDEFQSLHDRHLRLAADFDNYRRRAETEMRQSWIRAQADLVRKLLDALDDLERVSDLDPEATTVESVLEGVELVERKLHQAMKEAGAVVIDPEGESFDPNTMEAMMRVPTEEEEEDDRVDRVLQKGYSFKGHLVRPARVSVKKHG